MRDKTSGEDQQKVRTGNQPNAFAAIRNLVTGTPGTPASPMPAAGTGATISAS